MLRTGGNGRDEQSGRQSGGECLLRSPMCWGGTASSAIARVGRELQWQCGANGSPDGESGDSRKLQVSTLWQPSKDQSQTQMAVPREAQGGWNCLT